MKNTTFISYDFILFSIFSNYYVSQNIYLKKLLTNEFLYVIIQLPYRFLKHGKVLISTTKN